MPRSGSSHHPTGGGALRSAYVPRATSTHVATETSRSKQLSGGAIHTCARTLIIALGAAVALVTAAVAVAVVPTAVGVSDDNRHVLDGQRSRRERPATCTGADGKAFKITDGRYTGTPISTNAAHRLDGPLTIQARTTCQHDRLARLRRGLVPGQGRRQPPLRQVLGHAQGRQARRLPDRHVQRQSRQGARQPERHVRPGRTGFTERRARLEQLRRARRRRRPGLQGPPAEAGQAREARQARRASRARSPRSELMPSAARSR